MQKTFTKEFMLSNKGCYSEAHLMQCSFMKTSKITIKSILESDIPMRDKYWFVCKKLLTAEQNRDLAITTAETVLENYEKEYPGNKSPRQCLEAAKDYLAGSISLKTLQETRNNCYEAIRRAYIDSNYGASVSSAICYNANYIIEYPDAGWSLYYVRYYYGFSGCPVGLSEFLEVYLMDFVSQL